MNPPALASLEPAFLKSATRDAAAPPDGKAGVRLGVAVIDSQPVVRAGVCGWLQQQDGVGVVLRAAGPAAALARLGGGRPQLVITEVRFPEGGGGEWIRSLRAEVPGAWVVVFTLRPSRALADVCRRLGAHAVVDKRRSFEGLLQALRRLGAGRRGGAAGGGTAIPGSGPAAVKQVPTDVTPRERQVLRLLGQGQTVAQIAAGLECSTKTVEAHRDSLRRKLDCGSGVELTHWAIQWLEAWG